VLAKVDRPRDLAAANFNSPGQVVLSGTPDAIEQATEEAKKAGGEESRAVTSFRRVPLAALEGAARGLAEALDRVEIRPARFPILANATAREAQSPDEIRVTLREQLLSPVLWEQSVRRSSRKACAASWRSARAACCAGW